jgi:outer membrane biogenesis lipoprotein LolB
MIHIVLSIALAVLVGCSATVSPETKIETRPVVTTPFDTHIKKLNKYYKDKYRGQPQSR